MVVNSRLGSTMEFRTGLRPATVGGKLHRDMVVRTMGLKRMLEAKGNAQSRLGCEHPRAWYDEDGVLKPEGDFELGKKGGTYPRPVPLRGLREQTPPVFTTRTARRAMPGRISQQDMYINTRRMCDKLTEQQRCALFGTVGAYHKHAAREDTSLPPGFQTIEFNKAARQLARLPLSDLDVLLAQYDYAIDHNNRGEHGGSGCTHIGVSLPSNSAGAQDQLAMSILSAESTQSFKSTRPFYFWDPITKYAMKMSGTQSKQSEPSTPLANTAADLAATAQSLGLGPITTRSSVRSRAASAPIVPNRHSAVSWSSIVPPVLAKPEVIAPNAIKGDQKFFLNNLYMEQPKYGSKNWKTMFRNGNKTFNNVQHPLEKSARRCGH